MKTAVKAIYDRDSKRYHRFVIKMGKNITGTIYVRKGDEVPNLVKVYLQTPGEEEQQQKFQVKMGEK